MREEGLLFFSSFAHLYELNCPVLSMKPKCQQLYGVSNYFPVLLPKHSLLLPPTLTCCPCPYSPVSDSSPHTITHGTLFNSKLVTLLPSWRIATLLRAKLYLPRQWPTRLYAIYFHLAMLVYPPSLPSSSHWHHHYDLCASLSSLNCAWLMFTPGPL